jgi:hypothetical protein
MKPDPISKITQVFFFRAGGAYLQGPEFNPSTTETKGRKGGRERGRKASMNWLCSRLQRIFLHGFSHSTG